MPKRGRDIIVVGASAGGVEALSRLVGSLPSQLPASIFVVVHVPSHYRSRLAEILARAGSLPAVEAADNMAIEKGRIYVAPPDKHLLLEPKRIRVLHGPKENRHRPAIDPLFRSAAWALGSRVIGVVLSGTLDDGAAGLWAVKSTGGVSIVQDPAEAKFSGMPTSALLYSKVDHCLPLNEIAPLLTSLAGEPVADRDTAQEPLGEEISMDANSMKNRSERPERSFQDLDRIGDLSAFTCPACGGALWELAESGVLRYRCHVGHAFNGESLVDEQSELVEKAVYTALRALKEQVTIMRRVGGQLGEGQQARFDERSKELEEAAEVLKSLLQSGKT